MLLTAKKLYWLLESYFFELKTRFFLNQVQPIKHTLPERLIISLTSYTPRFRKLHLTIRCLLKQSIRADLIILWVADNDKFKLPASVLTLQQDGVFEIRTCTDIRSYKKIIPTLEDYPDAFIVTADDDFYYPSKWLERLINCWDGDYKNIIAHRVHEISFSETGTPKPYGEWRFEATGKVSSNLTFATGGGGVLYPPKALDKRVNDPNKFMKICGTADDVWLFWMARLNESKTTKTPGKFNMVCWPGSQHEALAHENLSANANDTQIENMVEEFGWPVKCL